MFNYPACDVRTRGTTALFKIKLSNLRKSTFLVNFAYVFTGTVFAQLITVALSPVLSRIYSPENFGVLGAFTSLVAILSAGSTFQYNQALVLVEDEMDAENLLGLSVSLVVLVSVLVLALCFLMPGAIGKLSESDIPPHLIFMIPVSLLLLSLGIVFRSWCVRQKNFKLTGSSQFVKSFTTVTLQIATGFSGAGNAGLIIGSIAGDLTAFLSLTRHNAFSRWKKIFSGLSYSRMKALAVEHRDFALYTNTQGILGAAVQGVPVLFWAKYYGMVSAGCFVFATRLISMPFNLLSISLRQVLLQKYCEVYKSKGSLRNIYAKITVALMAIVTMPAVIIILWGAEIFSFVFGETWNVAGQMSSWLIVGQALVFCFEPSNLVCQVVGKQRIMLLIHIMYLVFSVSSVIVGGNYFPPDVTVAIYSVVRSLVAISIGLVAWGTIKNGTESRPI